MQRKKKRITNSSAPTSTNSSAPTSTNSSAPTSGPEVSKIGIGLFRTRSHDVLWKIREALQQHGITTVDAFIKMDINRDGILTFEEFVHGLRVGLRMDLSDEDVAHLGSSMDLDQNGSVDMEEWLLGFGLADARLEKKVWRTVVAVIHQDRLTAVSPNPALALFSMFDQDGNGLLSLEEFCDRGGLKLSHAQIKTLFWSLDMQKNGMI